MLPIDCHVTMIILLHDMIILRMLLPDFASFVFVMVLNKIKGLCGYPSVARNLLQMYFLNYSKNLAKYSIGPCFQPIICSLFA